jgi:hypothetical protein
MYIKIWIKIHKVTKLKILKTNVLFKIKYGFIQWYKYMSKINF